MDNETIIAQIKDELTVCYEHIGRKAPDSLPVVAASIQEAIGFESPEQVHVIFVKAKDIESIPTQKVLKECFRNYGEEVLKYRTATSHAAIGYDDPREAWLPKEDIRRRINLNMAIRNLCAAISDREYTEFCKANLTTTEKRGDKNVVVLVNRQKAMAFNGPKKDMLRRLYLIYWRMLPIAKGYPADAPLNLGLIPPTTQQFRIMLDHEAKVNGYAA